MGRALRPAARRGVADMMLATRCPYCRTTFRVVQDQLKICNGIVRCGSCRQVFNGIEQLQSADTALQAAREQARQQSSWPESAQSDINPVTIMADDSPSANEYDKADFTEAHDDLKLILTPSEEPSEPVRTPLAETPDPAFADDHESGPAQQTDEEANIDLVLHTDDRHEPTLAEDMHHDSLRQPERDFRDDPIFAPTQPPDERMALPSAPLMPDDDEPAYKLELRSQPVEPAFVQRARKQERYGRFARIVLVLLILGLLPALLLQTVDAFHQRIGAAFPDARPLLAQACEVIRCQTDLPAQIEAVSIDASELHAPKNSEKAFTLNLLLRNRSAMAQAWPMVELTLNDAQENPVARRVFNAPEYLAGTQDAAKGFAAGSEQSVKLVFEVEELKPVGYRVYLFYP